MSKFNPTTWKYDRKANLLAICNGPVSSKKICNGPRGKKEFCNMRIPFPTCAKAQVGFSHDHLAAPSQARHFHRQKVTTEG